MSTRVKCSCLVLAMLMAEGCSRQSSTHAQPSTTDDSSAGSGGARGPSAGAGGARGGVTNTGARDAATPCVDGAAPDDEFARACPDPNRDAGRRDGGKPPPPLPDAGHKPPPRADAAVPLDAGHDAASPPLTHDEGLCSMRDASCEFGHAATTVGSTFCTIAGNSLQVDRKICEVCNKSTHIVDFSVTVMDCGGCTQVYSEGFANLDVPLSRGECNDRTESAGLEWTAADPHCVDVYAFTGSGESSAGGTLTQSTDLVRVCRCDRTTDTCITCVNGDCDSSP